MSREGRGGKLLLGAPVLNAQVPQEREGSIEIFQLKKITHSPWNLFTLRIRSYFCVNFSSPDSSHAIPEMFWEELQRLETLWELPVFQELLQKRKVKHLLLKGWIYSELDSKSLLANALTLPHIGVDFKLCQFSMFKQKIACWRNWRLFCVLSNCLFWPAFLWVLHNLWFSFRFSPFGTLQTWLYVATPQRQNRFIIYYLYYYHTYKKQWTWH